MAIFASKYFSICRTCNGRINIGDMIQWSRQGGSHHRTAADCAAAKAAPVAPAKPAVIFDGAPLAGFLAAARARGLKFPKAIFIGPNNSRILLKLAGDRSTNPGAVFVFLSDVYAGSIAVDGTVRGSLASNADALATLTAIAADPASAAKAYGMLTGNCSFCMRELTDAGSVEVGYGPVCAKKYGLPHTAKGTAKLVAVADLDPDMPLTYGPNVAHFRNGDIQNWAGASSLNHAS
jgi:uncharacterized protein DUF6011